MAIIVTLSNTMASDANLLRQFALRGAGKFRFNTSFSSPELINNTAKLLQEIGASLNHKMDVIIDLPGKKRRLGKFRKPFLDLAPGQILTFQLGHEYGENDEMIPIPEDDFLDLVEPGDRFFVKDGKIKFLITGIDMAKKSFTARCLNSTRVESFLGYSLHLKKLASLQSPAARLNLEKYDFRYISQIAVSYTESPETIREIEKSVRLLGHEIEMIAKIETLAGFELILDLDKVCHELWFCRGDFTNNVAVENLYRFEKKLLGMLPRLKSPLYVAGENMMGMIHDSLPSRGEIVHLAHLFDQGVAGIVLSDETVKSETPLDVFLFAQKINNKYGSGKGTPVL